MKKALALMLAGAMSAGLLAGCGSAQGTASAAPPPPARTAPLPLRAAVI